MSSTKFFTHTCRECELTFRLLIKPTQAELMKIRCPDCRTPVWLDNRDGGLAKLKRKRLLSRPIREYDLKPGVDYVDPTPEPPPPLEISTGPAKSTAAANDPALPESSPTDSIAASASSQPQASSAADSDAAAKTPSAKEHQLPRGSRLRGYAGAWVSQLYLLRYRIASVFLESTGAMAAGLRSGQDAIRTTGSRAVQSIRTALAAVARLAGETTIAGVEWTRVRGAAVLAALQVYARSVLLAGRRIRRTIVVRRGDFGPALRRRLRNSRLFPALTIERVRDVGDSIADAFRSGYRPGDSAGARAAANSTRPDALLNSPGNRWSPGRLLAALAARTAALRALLWPQRLPGPVLAGAYLAAPLVLLAVYIGASFAFPRLALSESMEVFEARLQPVQPNRVLDRDGGLLAELFARKTSNSRIAAGEAGFPDSLKRKLLFVEDESFYEHGGIRPLAIVRAFFRNLAAGRYVEGGSTITQQVARMALRNRSRSLTRKFQEAVLCRQLESRLTKNQILTAYVNHVYMGHGAYGMQVAAAFFFQRPLNELNFAEELMLVTVLPAPAEFSPLRNPARLEQRMDLLYSRMVREDFPRIPADRYRHQKNLLFAGAQDLSPNQSVFASRTNHAPYVAEYVRLALRMMARNTAKRTADQSAANAETATGGLAAAAAGIFSANDDESASSAKLDRAPLRRRASRTQRARPLSDFSAAHIAELFRTGVTVHTSIDPALQKAATRETPLYIGEVNPRYPPYEIVDGKPVRRRGLRDRLAREYEDARLGLQVLGLPAPRSDTPRLQAAAIGVAPATGAVLFMQGGAGFRAGNQLNHAIAMRRQTGSAIKPIVYSAAIESGRASPASVFHDKPFPEDGPGPEEDPEWKPRNYKDDYHGKVSVRFALQKSLNIPTIQLAQRTGMSRLALQFQKFFFPDENVFRKRFRRDLTVAIGSLEMSPLEMASAYTAFGNNGVVRRPYLIERVVAHDGTVLFARGTDSAPDEFNLRIPEKRRVLSGDVAHVMASLLRDSARKGGAGYWSRFTLGKTGTSNHHRDAWFVGVLPGVSAAVWVGYDQPTNSMGRATGSAVAGPLWARIIASGMGNRAPGKFRFDPHGVYHRVCTKTGAKAAAQCPHTKKEIFPRAHPPGKCWKHSD